MKEIKAKEIHRVSAWATVYKKDGHDYKKGEIYEVATFRRVLAMHKPRHVKIIQVAVIYKQ